MVEQGDVIYGKLTAQQQWELEHKGLFREATSGLIIPVGTYLTPEQIKAVGIAYERNVQRGTIPNYPLQQEGKVEKISVKTFGPNIVPSPTFVDYVDASGKSIGGKTFVDVGGGKLQVVRSDMPSFSYQTEPMITGTVVSELKPMTAKEAFTNIKTSENKINALVTSIPVFARTLTTTPEGYSRSSIIRYIQKAEDKKIKKLDEEINKKYTEVQEYSLSLAEAEANARIEQIQKDYNSGDIDYETATRLADEVNEDINNKLNAQLTEVSNVLNEEYNTKLQDIKHPVAAELKKADVAASGLITRTFDRTPEQLATLVTQPERLGVQYTEEEGFLFMQPSRSKGAAIVQEVVAKPFATTFFEQPVSTSITIGGAFVGGAAVGAIGKSSRIAGTAAELVGYTGFGLDIKEKAESYIVGEKQELNIGKTILETAAFGKGIKTSVGKGTFKGIWNTIFEERRIPRTRTGGEEKIISFVRKIDVGEKKSLIESEGIYTRKPIYQKYQSGGQRFFELLTKSEEFSPTEKQIAPVTNILVGSKGKLINDKIVLGKVQSKKLPAKYAEEAEAISVLLAKRGDYSITSSVTSPRGRVYAKEPSAERVIKQPMGLRRESARRGINELIYPIKKSVSKTMKAKALGVSKDITPFTIMVQGNKVGIGKTFEEGVIATSGFIKKGKLGQKQLSKKPVEFASYFFKGEKEKVIKPKFKEQGDSSLYAATLSRLNEQQVPKVTPPVSGEAISLAAAEAHISAIKPPAIPRKELPSVMQKQEETKSIFGTSVEERTRVKEESIGKTISVQTSLSKIKVREREEEETKVLGGIGYGFSFGNMPIEGTREETREGILFAPAERQIQRERQEAKAKLKTISITPNIISPNLITPHEIPKTPRKIKTNVDEVLYSGKERGYIPLVKFGGIYKAVGKPMTKSKAIAYGALQTDVTLARSFKIIPTKKFVKKEKPFETSLTKFRTFQQARGKRTSLVGTFIEKSKYALEKGEEAIIRPLSVRALKAKASERRVRLF